MMARSGHSEVHLAEALVVRSHVIFQASTSGAIAIPVVLPSLSEEGANCAANVIDFRLREFHGRRQRNSMLKCVN
jgi:hypothetical protein